MPGSLLSRTRTNKSLLITIVHSIMQLFDRSSPLPTSCGLGILPQKLLSDAMDIVSNCSRNDETAYVITKVSHYT